MEDLDHQSDPRTLPFENTPRSRFHTLSGEALLIVMIGGVLKRGQRFKRKREDLAHES